MRDPELQARIDRMVREDVAIAPWSPHWADIFREERERLLHLLPTGLIGRIEHFGSTAVPGLAAKPIVDMLVEVTSLEETRRAVPPILEPLGYDYFWRPAQEEGPPYYAWFVRRNAAGQRTHHIHMVESHFEHWDRLLFRDYLIAHPDVAAEYQALKYDLAKRFPADRVSYTNGKGDFVARITAVARAECDKSARS